MARYLAIWEAGGTERATGRNLSRWGGLMGSVEQDMTKGAVRDFGFFAGAQNGFAIFEGTKGEVERTIQQYAPYLSFTVYPLASAEETEQVVKAEPEESFPLIRERLRGRSFHCYTGLLKMK